MTLPLPAMRYTPYAEGTEPMYSRVFGSDAAYGYPLTGDHVNRLHKTVDAVSWAPLSPALPRVTAQPGWVSGALVWRAPDAPFARIVVVTNEVDVVFKDTPVSFSSVAYGEGVIVGFSAGGSSAAKTVYAYVSRDLGDTWAAVAVGSALSYLDSGVTADGVFWCFSADSKKLFYSADLASWASVLTSKRTVSFNGGELLVISNTNELLVYKGGGMISLPPLTNFVDAVYPWQGGVLAFGLLDVGGMAAARLTDIGELTTAAFLPADYEANDYFDYNPSTEVFLGRYGSMAPFTPPFWTRLKQAEQIGYEVPVQPIVLWAEQGTYGFGYMAYWGVGSISPVGASIYPDGRLLPGQAGEIYSLHYRADGKGVELSVVGVYSDWEEGALLPFSEVHINDVVLPKNAFTLIGGSDYTQSFYSALGVNPFVAGNNSIKFL